MKRFLRRAREALRGIVGTVLLELSLRDAFAFAGLGAVGYGLWQIYAPSAWIVVGAVLFLMGVRR
jgi:hypothetical protein